MKIVPERIIRHNILLCSIENFENIQVSRNFIDTLVTNNIVIGIKTAKGYIINTSGIDLHVDRVTREIHYFIQFLNACNQRGYSLLSVKN